MTGPAWSALLLAHRAALTGAAVWVLVVLHSGGGRLPGGVHVPARSLSTAVIALLVLAVLGIPLTRRRFGRRAFAGSEGRVLFAVTLTIYLAIGATYGAGDTVPARLLPLSLLREGDLDLDEFTFLYRAGRPHYLRQAGEHYVSAYPVAPALLAVPFYLVPALGGVDAAGTLVPRVEKLAAATVTALSVVVLHRLLQRLTSAGWAMALALVYGLATSSLSTSSQALWQHGPSQLALAAALHALVRGRDDPRWLVGSGFALTLAVLCRPSDALLALPLAAGALWRHGGRAWRLALGACPLTLQLWYNVSYFGSALHTQFPVLEAATWSTPFAEGLAGILFSPARGMLVYSPVLALAAVGGGALAWRRGGDPLLRCLGVGVAATLVLYAKWAMWWGGHSYGPRLLADLAPALVLLMVPVGSAVTRSRLTRSLFVLLAALSFTAHAAGVFWDGGWRWNRFPDVDRFPQRLWDWRDSPLANVGSDLLGWAVAAGRGIPTSRSRPDLVGASLHVTVGAPWPASSLVEPWATALTVRAVNTGAAAWRGAAGSGTVLLTWRWVGRTGEAGAAGGREGLRHDVLPGDTHDFVIGPDPPTSHPDLDLEITLVVDDRRHRAGAVLVPRARLKTQGTSPREVAAVDLQPARRAPDASYGRSSWDPSSARRRRSAWRGCHCRRPCTSQRCSRYREDSCSPSSTGRSRRRAR